MLELLVFKMAGLFLLMGLGFFLSRRALMRSAALEGMAFVVIDVCMPALFFTGILSTASKSIENKGLLVVLGVFVSALGWFLGWIGLALGLKRFGNKGTFLFLCAVGNSSFLPLPLAETLWGAPGLQACLFFILGANLFLFSVGIGLMSDSKKAEKVLILKGFLHPQALATAFALLMVALGVPGPAWALDPLRMVGAATIPLAMLVTGGLLAGVDLKTIENKGFLAVSQLIKLLLLPIIVGLGLKILGIQGVLAGVLFLQACMPSLASSGLYALRFGGNVKMASSGSFWSHVAALATIPALFWLFGYLG